MPSTHQTPTIGDRGRAGRWLLVMAIAACAGPTWALSADSRCGQLGLGTCREARASEFTSATVQWSDGAFTSLTAPIGAFNVYYNGRREEGDKISLYSDGTLQAALGQYTGRGPVQRTNYLVDKGQLPQATYANGGGYFGQASSSFLHGSTVNDSNLHMVGQAESNFGVNRAQTLMNGTVTSPYNLDANNLLRPGITGQINTRAGSSAYSLWQDGASFTGNSGAVKFEIQLDGSLTANAWLSYGLSAIDSNGQSHTILGSVAFGSLQPGSLVQHLTGSLTVDPALTYTLSSELVAYTAVPDFVSMTTGGTMSVLADFYNTARVDSITLPTGMQVAFASGSSYLSSRVVASPIPEPQSWALMTAGVLAVYMRRRTATANR